MEPMLAKDTTSKASDDTGRKDGHAAQAPAFDAAVGTTREYIGVYKKFSLLFSLMAGWDLEKHAGVQVRGRRVLGCRI